MIPDHSERARLLDGNAVSGHTATNAVTSAANGTAQNESWNFEHVRVEWTLSLVFASISSPVLFYVVLAQAMYLAGTTFRSPVQCGWSETGENGDDDTSTPSSGRRALAWLNLTNAICVFLYVTSDLLTFVERPEPFCAVYHVFKIACTALAIFGVYFALWLRAYGAFYLNPVMRNRRTRLARALNWLTLLCVVTMVACSLVAFLQPPFYASTPLGCREQASASSSDTEWLLLATSTVLCQLLLLGSLLYPLCAHRANARRHGLPETDVFARILKRSLAACVACVISDAANAVFEIEATPGFAYVRNVVFGLNLEVNLFALLFSFADYRTRLIPCRFRRRASSPRNAANDELDCAPDIPGIRTTAL